MTEGSETPFLGSVSGGDEGLRVRAFFTKGAEHWGKAYKNQQSLGMI